MSKEEIRKAYRFTGTEGRAFRFDADSKEHVALKPGELVQMTEKTADGLKDRFKLVPDSALGSDVEALAEEVRAAAAGVEAATARAEVQKVIEKAQAGKEQAEAQAEASALVDRGVGDATNKINQTVGVALLELAEESENAKPKPRAGVLKAINARIEKILSEE